MEELYDTCGLMVLKLEGINGIQPFVIEHTSNTCSYNVVLVTLIVCVTIFLVSLVVANTICRWRKKNKKEQEAEKSHSFSTENVDNKEKSKKEYISKLSAFLEELSKSKENSKMKDISDPACKEYLDVLTYLAKNGDLDNYNPTKQG